MGDNNRELTRVYRNYLEKYVFEGASEGVLMEAYLELSKYFDASEVQVANILDLHTRTLREIMGVRRDSDNIQWIYIDRATEFLAQVLIVFDALLLKLRENVERDALTGLGNRVALIRYLPQVLSEAEASRKPFTVAMVDLDDFKEINDLYGHETGDQVLRRVAGMLRGCVRDRDMVVRYGGEEFIVVLADSDREKATIPLERIRARLAETHFGEAEIRLTASIGAAEFPADRPQNAEELIRFADRAMYAAKRMGKNQIIFYRDMVPGT